MNATHLYLRDLRSAGRAEPVHAIYLGGATYRVLHSPGIVYGIAAEDEIKVDAEGNFHVLRRAGNLAVRLLCANGVGELIEDVRQSVERLGGWLDGGVRNGAVFTIPIAAGFKAVECIFDELERRHAGVVWEYGNVYDDKDQPLLWWAS
jgi:hypothetical protein